MKVTGEHLRRLRKIHGLRRVWFVRRAPSLVVENGAGPPPSVAYGGGGLIALSENGRQRDLGNLVHDCAHYLVAPRHRRDLPDFGLGTIGGLGGPFEVIGVRAADKEEERASALGIHIQWIMGDRKGARRTYEDHGWGWEWDKMLRTLRPLVCLVRKGVAGSP